MDAGNAAAWRSTRATSQTAKSFSYSANCWVNAGLAAAMPGNISSGRRISYLSMPCRD